mmetsp:Transcript_22437/g.70187  ORF Transcript_22437/g.70187 Transcript_22437/m.70187 type:complete len:106 (-) Transcript_22437:912-1229(-)
MPRVAARTRRRPPQRRPPRYARAHCIESFIRVYMIASARTQLLVNAVLRTGIELEAEGSWDGKKPVIPQGCNVSAAQAAGAQRMPDDDHDKVMEELRRRDLATRA